MIKAFVGSGGKTTSVFKERDRLLKQNKTVLICTSTHMFIESDAVLSQDIEEIKHHIATKGWCIAGTRADEKKMGPLDADIFMAACGLVDEVLIEADGSRNLPLKIRRDNEPVIYNNVDEIVLVGGCRALDKPLKDVCHHYELWDIPGDTVVDATVFQAVYNKYYTELVGMYPDKVISRRICQTHNLYEQAFASLVENGEDASVLDPKWFDIHKHLFIFGAGHVGYALSKVASYLEYHVHIMDERKELIEMQDFNHVDQVICDKFANLEKYIIPNSYFAIMTPQHDNDYECLKLLVDKPYRYLGMIGSKKKVALEFNRLRSDGVPEELITPVHSPIGVPIGSQSPKEIAISIMAEIIQVKNDYSKASISAKLADSNEDGVLCVIVQKDGSSPRGIGSMMLVTDKGNIDTIGGGKLEYLIIEEAKNNPYIHTRAYSLDEGDVGVCGGDNTVIFIPVRKQDDSIH